jgi:hypothetical protein
MGVGREVPCSGSLREVLRGGTPMGVPGRGTGGLPTEGSINGCPTRHHRGVFPKVVHRSGSAEVGNRSVPRGVLPRVMRKGVINGGQSQWSHRGPRRDFHGGNAMKRGYKWGNLRFPRREGPQISPLRKGPQEGRLRGVPPELLPGVSKRGHQTGRGKRVSQVYPQVGRHVGSPHGIHRVVLQ